MCHLELYDKQKHFDVLINLKYRQNDYDEVVASSGMTPKEVLMATLDSQMECYVMVEKGEVFGVMGIALSDVFGAVVPWMIATEEIMKHQLTLLKLSRKYVNEWKAKYKFLVNLVDSRNVSSIKWLEWLGFNVNKEGKWILCDPEVPFYAFTMEELNV